MHRLTNVNDPLLIMLVSYTVLYFGALLIFCRWFDTSLCKTTPQRVRLMFWFLITPWALSFYQDWYTTSIALTVLTVIGLAFSALTVLIFFCFIWKTDAEELDSVTPTFHPSIMPDDPCSITTKKPK